MVGFNFADKDEANHFKDCIEEKLNAKQQRKMGLSNILRGGIFEIFLCNQTFFVL